ncbi:TetR/AcrR family transcriptional regulator [Bacillus sp. ISL-47]|uniref:TetR/AcrR family transcriptional regulator n=1 Tax=Bacillus sp. ISL-47 TaxID=2819130 RepID=UPI001BE541FB|nr:TetR/AcrR family transcriptional regulator [Bacillus sp. ISL-47]MBT2687818.1 TetR/AcrR family transcriptional regulator [Bacillus sp. ISL-47]MBT2708105.1 TetR/AcrR family transcriptional regulator [Pseudomonas sp. ISL-84]
MKRKEQKEYTKQLIFKSAVELFKKQGFQNTTVQQITDHAGVAKGTFFNYFHSKESVLHLVGKSQLKLMHAFYKDVMDSSESIEENLHKLFKFMAINNEEFGPILLLSIFHISTVVKDFQISETQLAAEFRSILISLIEEGKKRGEFNDQANASQIAKMIVNSFFGTLFYWVHHSEQETLPALLSDVMASYITVLKSKFSLPDNRC